MKKTSLTSKAISVFASVALVIGLCPSLAYAAPSTQEQNVQEQNEQASSEAIESQATSELSLSSENEQAQLMSTSNSTSNANETNAALQNNQTNESDLLQLKDDTWVDYGLCGLFCWWYLTDAGELTIDGIGHMWNYRVGYSPWSEYVDDIKTITIDEGITSIGDAAFAECGEISSIVIPSSVTSIGEAAFYQCESLASIIIPESVECIDFHAFCECTNLQTIVFVGDAPYMEDESFASVVANAYYPEDNYTWKPGVMRNYGGWLTWAPRPDVSDAYIEEIDDQTYTGAEIEPELSVSYEGEELVLGRDYTVAYSNNINVGTATATITGTGLYVGTQEVTFDISAADITSATIESVADQTYTGQEIQPDICATFNGMQLVLGIDYELDYTNNVNAGTATITVTGKGNFTGTTTVQFTINRAEGKASFEESEVAKYLDKSTFTNPLTTVSGGKASFSSSNEAVATVNETTGEVSIKSIGQTIITADVAETQNYTACQASYTLNVISASVSYSTHVQYIGWQDWVADGKMAGTTGNEYRLEGIKIKLEGLGELDGGIEYRTHVQDIGWQQYEADGEMSGTSGKALRLEAIDMHLTGEAAEYYDVYYRVHAQNIGWMGWAKNGEEAGSIGYAYRLEAIQIVLVEKGGAAPTDVEGITSVVDYSYDSKTEGTSSPYRNELVSYNTHVQNEGWQAWAKCGAMSGTSGKALRLEGIHIQLGGAAAALDGSIEYSTHVQNIGWQDWVADGTMSGTTGLAYRLEAIKIKLTDEVEANYDVYYRVHAQNIGWMGWAKNGENAGTEGLSYRLEGIQIVLVTKGEPAPGKTFNSITSDTDEAFVKATEASAIYG